MRKLTMTLHFTKGHSGASVVLEYLTLLGLCSFGGSALAGDMPANTDAMWYDQSPWLDDPDNDRFSEIEVISQYIKARDGVKIAVSAYLPADRDVNERLPAILHQTRYWRGNEPSNSDTVSVEDTDLSLYPVRHGYAYVAVDVRGTGASFDHRKREWSEREVLDGNHVLDWIVDQPWSNGRVIAEGISYPGGTAYQALSNNHPALVGSVVASIGWDMYADVMRPGGITNSGIVDTWIKYVKGLDRNCYLCDLDDAIDPNSATRVAVVDNDKDGQLRAQAVQMHQANFDLQQFLSSAAFSDSHGVDSDGNIYKEHSGQPITGRDFGFYRVADSVHRSKAGMWIITGWFDGGFVDANIQRYLRHSDNQNVKLLIGPWSHNFRHHISPWRKAEEPEFDYEAAVLRFAEYHAKEVDNGLYDEPAIHYFTMGEEQWKTATTWPPGGQRMETLFFGSRGQLLDRSPEGRHAEDVYTVDFDVSSGGANRWVSQANVWGVSIGYEDRQDVQEQLLTYTSSPLEADMEVTGAPRVTLFLSTSTEDAAVHLYLEDVSPNGEVEYVTEGLLRLSCRATADPPFESHILYRTLTESDCDSSSLGRVVSVDIDMISTSYLFKEGHSIRLGIAGADKSVFEPIPNDGRIPVFQVQRSSVHPSRIRLPVMQ